MKNKTCPKYGAHEILRVPAEVGAFGTGNVIPTGMTIFSAVEVTRYVCATCGFVEQWIDSPGGEGHPESLRVKSAA